MYFQLNLTQDESGAKYMTEKILQYQKIGPSVRNITQIKSFENGNFQFCFKLLKSQSRCLGVATMVLGTFPKTFSQGRLPKWQLPNCAISQVATWKNTLGKLIFGKNPWALILPHYLAHFYFCVRSWHTSKKTSQSLQINFVYKTNTETLSAQPYLSNTRICT